MADEPEQYSSLEAYPGLVFCFASSNRERSWPMDGTWMVIAREMIIDGPRSGRWKLALLGPGPSIVEHVGPLGLIYVVFDPERELNLELRSEW